MNVCRQPVEGLACKDNRSELVCTTVADASGAARIRIEFASWLQQHFPLDDERRCDVILAVYEALANAAEFGYLEAPGQGTIECTASYDDDIDILDVEVSDRGRWRPSMRASASVHDALRGRGIPLMRVLADDVRIDTSERGTQVSLTWARLLKPSNRPASG
jgi:anti-sigma regulatory factor (Ser/Thr protein kinase)